MIYLVTVLLLSQLCDQTNQVKYDQEDRVNKLTSDLISVEHSIKL